MKSGFEKTKIDQTGLYERLSADKELARITRKYFKGIKDQGFGLNYALAVEMANAWQLAEAEIEADKDIRVIYHVWHGNIGLLKRHYSNKTSGNPDYTSILKRYTRAV